MGQERMPVQGCLDRSSVLIINRVLKTSLQQNPCIVRELRESRGGHPGLSVLTSLLASVVVKLYWTMLRHWSQLVPNMSTTSEDIKHHFIIRILALKPAQKVPRKRSKRWEGPFGEGFIYMETWRDRSSQEVVSRESLSKRRSLIKCFTGLHTPSNHCWTHCTTHTQ